MKLTQPDNYRGNILIVDDTPANLRLLVGMLHEQGYEVRPSPNGELALAAARGLPPDLILLDINMPGINGYEVCKQLKADKRTREIPVIFISALSEVMDKVQAFSVGGVDYITKPFQVEEVLARVETHLTLRSLQKSLQAKNEDLAQANDKLAQTLHQLQATQSQLIESEKMAALGQLIAGIAHEINTPLGAISSSVRTIANFWDESLETLIQFLQELSPQLKKDFLGLLQMSSQQSATLSTREQRKIKRSLTRQLESQSVENADIIANFLVGIGIYEDLENIQSLFKEPDSYEIFKFAYQIASLKTSTKTISTASERAGKIVFALKNYARYDQTGEMMEANIMQGIETILTLYHNQLKQGVEVIRDYQDSLPKVICYPDELNQVWTNLIHNALQAMKNRGTLKISITEQEKNVKVSITDSGEGIPQEIQKKIFQPFFTTKPAGEGSGLGLDIVKKIIDKHQGKIEVESMPGQTTFTISLPINPYEKSKV